MSTPHPANAHLIEALYDGGTGNSLDYIIRADGDHIGRVTIDRSTKTAHTVTPDGIINITPRKYRAAIDYLVDAYKERIA